MNYYVFLLAAVSFCFCFLKQNSTVERGVKLKSVTLFDNLEIVLLAFSLLLLCKHESGIRNFD